MIVINQKLMLIYEYEPVVNFRQDIVSYELIIRPLASPDYDDFSPARLFSGMSFEQKIDVFKDQLNEVKKFGNECIRQNVKITINIDDDHLAYLKSSPDTLIDISDSGIIDLEFNETLWNKKRDPAEDFRMFHEYGIGLWLDNFDVYKIKSSESELAYYKGVKIDQNFFRYLLKKSNKEIYFLQLIQGLKKIGKKIIVEGVGNNEHFNFLLNKSIDGMQGEVWPSKKSVIA